MKRAIVGMGVLVLLMGLSSSAWANMFWTKDAKYDACAGDVRRAYYAQYGATHSASEPVPVGGWTKFQEDKTRPGMCDCVRQYPNGSVSKFDKIGFGCPV